MKLLPLLIGALNAENTQWPATSFKQTCGAVNELPMTSNTTCVVSLDKGNAAWINAGGPFITEASTTQNAFYIHTYDGHGEEREARVRFVAWYSVPYVWHGHLKNGKYPDVWADSCGAPEDISISCT